MVAALEEAPVIIAGGSSNMAGFGALLDDVPLADMTRWVGGNHPPIPSTSAQRPYHVTVPGTRILTPRRPYASNVSRPIATGTANTTTQVFFTGAAVTFAANEQWVYIRANAVGQGQFFRVSAIDADTPVAGTHRVTITGGTFSPVPSSDGALNILSDAYRAADAQRTVTFDHTTENVVLAAHGYVDATPVVFVLDGGTMPPELTAGTTYYTISTAAGTFRLATSAANAIAGTFISFSDNGTATVKVRLASTFTVTKNGGAAFASSMVGKDVMLADDIVRRITAVATDTLTFDRTVTPPTVDTHIIVLTGANSCQTIGDLADPTKCVLQDLTFYLDQNAPVFLTGLEYCNYDATPFQNPRVAYAAGPTINSIVELSFQVRSRLNKPIVVLPLGISASMVSPFLNGQVLGPVPAVPFAGYIGWFHDLLSLDWHPSSPSSIYTALINAYTCTKLLLQAENNKAAKVHGFFLNLADNDPVDAERNKLIGRNQGLLRDAVRAHVGDPDIAFVTYGPSRYGGSDSNREFIYSQLVDLAENDPKTAVFDTRNGFVFPQDYMAADGLHFSALGQIKLGQGGFASWDTIQTVGAGNVALDIVNLALANIGHSARVTAIDGSDTSAEARHAARFYPTAIKMLLEQHPWDFATRRKPLVLASNPTASLLVRTEEWRYAYDLPRNMAGAIAVLAPGSASDAPTQPFIIETDLNGNKILLTNIESAIVRYNSKVTNPRLFTGSFVQAAAWALASMLAGPIIKGQEGHRVATNCLQMMRTFFGQAATHDANQRQVEVAYEAPWMV